jgi:hypothetical protein
MKFSVATRKASSEPSSYTLISNNGTIGGVMAFSGEHATLYLHKISSGSSSASNASPWNITTGSFGGGNTTGTCDIVFIGASDITPANTTTHTAPSGFTKRDDIQDTSTHFRTGFTATKDGAAAGETGAYTGVGTAGSTNAGWAGIAIALLNSSQGMVPGLIRRPQV